MGWGSWVWTFLVSSRDPADIGRLSILLFPQLYLQTPFPSPEPGLRGWSQVFTVTRPGHHLDSEALALDLQPVLRHVLTGPRHVAGFRK